MVLFFAKSKRRPPDTLLEESALSYSEARIHPLTHVSVDRAYQAKLVGSNFLLVILFAIRCSPIYE